MAEYIEREEAFNAILKLVPKVDGDGYCWVIRGDAATAIDNIPAADVRPVVRGKWKHSIQGIIPSGQCSNCRAWDKVTRFCPNCGADMREANDEKA